MQNDALVEIETDKVDMEVESMASGVLRKVMVQAGETVPVGQLLAVVGGAEEDVSSVVSANGGAPAAKREDSGTEKKAAPVPAPAPVAVAAGPSAVPEPPKAMPAAPTGRILASPLARRLARDAGIDLSALQGSGPGGRIIRRDVEGASTAGPMRVPRMMPSPQGPEYRDEPLSSMRKIIAQRLAQSLGPVPHFYLTI